MYNETEYTLSISALLPRHIHITENILILLKFAKSFIKLKTWREEERQFNSVPSVERVHKLIKLTKLIKLSIILLILFDMLAEGDGRTLSNGLGES